MKDSVSKMATMLPVGVGLYWIGKGLGDLGKEIHGGLKDISNMSSSVEAKVKQNLPSTTTVVIGGGFVAAALGAAAGAANELIKLIGISKGSSGKDAPGTSNNGKGAPGGNQGAGDGSSA